MFLRLLVLLGPVGCGVASGVTFSRLVPPPPGPAEIGWWVLLFALSGLATEVVSRLARRLLPLAVLMKLTLIFPDQAPSRFAMARRAGNTRNLEERVRHAKEHGLDDDPTRAAEMILELVAALSAHDRRTRGHSERVRALTDLLAEALPLTEDDRDRLRWAALLHDVGKLEVPGRILNKPGRPDATEWETLRRHPDEGARLAKPLLPWLGVWGLAIEQHHERFDGRGYPRRLSGTDISRGARMLALTDAFETMTAPRPYRKPLAVSAAREELAKMAGSQFDPHMVRAFLSLSLGRLWWIAGPMAWLVQLPIVGQGTQAARLATAGVTKALVGVTAVTVTGGLFGGRGHTASATPNPPPDVTVAAGATAGTNSTDASSSAEDHIVEADQHSDDGPGEPTPDDAGDDHADDPAPGDGDGGDHDGGDGGSGDDGRTDDGGGGGGSSSDSGVIGGTVDQVTGTVDDTVDTAGDAVQDVTDTVDDAADDLLDTAGGLLASPGDLTGGG